MENIPLPSRTQIFERNYNVIEIKNLTPNLTPYHDEIMQRYKSHIICMTKKQHNFILLSSVSFQRIANR